MAKKLSPSARLKARYMKEAAEERKARGTTPRFEDEKEAPSAGGKKGSSTVFFIHCMCSF